MKKSLCVIFLALMIAAGLAAHQKDFPKLTGPYLGQTPPGERVEFFAPGIVTVEENFEHSAAVFSPDGQEVFWCTNVGAYTDQRIEGNLRLYTMKCIDGEWTAPRRAPFAEDTYVERPVFSPDGSRLYFERARVQDKDSDFDIFVVERTEGGWGDPVPVSPLINSPAMERLHCVTAEGSLYFSRDPFTPRETIYVSRWRNGTFAEPEVVEDIDTKKGAVLALVIATDQSFMLIDRMNDRYTSDLMVRFKKSGGSWTEWIKAPYPCGGFLSLSPDGKYLFFLNEGICWVSTSFIDKLKPKDLT